jgi:hypothetical protein
MKTAQISSCLQCPDVVERAEMQANGIDRTCLLCGRMKDRPLGCFDTQFLEAEVAQLGIPDWCPLPDTDGH